MAACSSTVGLGPVPDAGEPPPPLEDASVPDAAAPEDAGTPDATVIPPHETCPCGLCFERRAEPEYSDLWVRSPTDIWLVLGSRRIARFDGVAHTDVALPELDGELESILALDGGAGVDPFLAVSYRTERSGRRYALFQWNGTGWTSIDLPAALASSLNGSLVIAPTVDGRTFAALRGESSEPAVATVFSWDGALWSEHTFDGAFRIYALSAGHGRAFVTLQGEGTTIALFELADGAWQEFPAPSYPPEAGNQVPRIGIGDRLYAFSGYTHVWDPGAERWLELEGVTASRDGGGAGTQQWVVGYRFAHRFPDPSDTMAHESHSLPFLVNVASFPSDGPAWIAGGGLAYWSGSRWVTVVRDDRLYSRVRGRSATPVWGVSADDYWVVDDANASGAHAHDHIARSVPLEGPFFSSVHGLGPDDVWFVSSRAVHRLVDHEIVARIAIPDPWAVRGSTRLWGTDEAHLWLSTPNGVLRVRDGELVPELVPDPSHWAAGVTVIGGQSDRDVWALSQSGAVYHYDGTAWSAMPDIPLHTPDAQGRLIDAHVGATGVFVLAKVQLSAYRESWVAWTFRAGVWERTVLAEDEESHEIDIFGRGDEVWVVSETRLLWRLNEDDNWERDDRCRDSEALEGVEFATGWFPPDGAPAKIFSTNGSVLVAQEPE